MAMKMAESNKNGNNFHENMPAFWLQKMRTHFVRHDLDHDEHLTAGDYDAIADRVIKNNDITGTNALSIRRSMKELWNKYVSGGAITASVSWLEWVENVAATVATDEGRSNIVAPVPLFFDAIDTDHDGKINIDDYRNYFKCIGIDEQYAPGAYYCIDCQQRGYIDKQDFIEAIRDFFINTNENSPTKHLWGPLLN